jgi:hypothetical protein
MQHLDDALIAEWVDGAIAESSPQHGAIAAHVDQCDECRIRVEEERALAGHVRQLLGVATPPERTPPFEEVLHRAGTAPRRAVARRLPAAWRRLAWAATVVVAGGVGWYARGLVFEPEMTSLATGVAEPAEPTGTTGTAGTTGATGGVAERDAVDAPTVGSVARNRVEVATAEAAGRGAVADPPRAVGDEGRREAVAERQTAERELAEALRSPRRDAAPPAAPVAAEPRPMAQAVAPLADGLRMQKAALDPWAVTRLHAEGVLGQPLLLIGDLPIVSITIDADSGTVHVRQDLGGGAALELVQTRAVVAAEEAAEVAGARRAPTELRALTAEATPAVDTVVVNGVRVVGRAPVSADSLRRLLERLGR